MKEIISLIESAVFDTLPGIRLEQASFLPSFLSSSLLLTPPPLTNFKLKEVLCRHCRKPYWSKLGRGKFRKLFMNNTFDDCTLFSYEFVVFFLLFLFHFPHPALSPPFFFQGFASSFDHRRIVCPMQKGSFSLCRP